LEKTNKNKNKNITLKSTWRLEAPNFYHYFLANQLQLNGLIYITIITHGWNWNKAIDKYPSYRPPLSITINQAIKYMPTHHHQLTAWWKTNQITKSSLELNKLNPTLAQPRIHDTEQTSLFPHMGTKRNHTSSPLI